MRLGIPVRQHELDGLVVAPSHLLRDARRLLEVVLLQLPHLLPRERRLPLRHLDGAQILRALIELRLQSARLKKWEERDMRRM